MKIQEDQFKLIASIQFEFMLCKYLYNMYWKAKFINNFYYPRSYVQVCLSYKMLERIVKDSASCNIFVTTVPD
jgi:hypothetical protein